MQHYVLQKEMRFHFYTKGKNVIYVILSFTYPIYIALKILAFT